MMVRMGMPAGHYDHPFLVNADISETGSYAGF